MTLSDLYEVLTELDNCSVTYGQFEEGEAPELPWIAYYSTGELPFYADDHLYFTQVNVTIELYTEYKDLETEQKLEDLLYENELEYIKREEYIDEEDFYVIIYETLIH